MHVHVHVHAITQYMYVHHMYIRRWFQELCCLQGVSGQAYYFYKPCGKRKTLGIKPALAMERLKSGLRDPSMAFVYHCHNHYFCPVGFEEVPKRPSDAYK